MTRAKKILKVCVFGHVYFDIILRRRERRWGVHPLNRSREKKGEYVLLARELEKFPERYQQYFRMSQDRFNFILGRIKASITSEPTKFQKKPVTPKEKLVVTLK